MPYNHREISFQVAATRFHKVIIETTRVLLLRERREGNPGEAARQGGMQNNEMEKSTMDSDALGIGRRTESADSVSELSGVCKTKLGSHGRVFRCRGAGLWRTTFGSQEGRSPRGTS
jgi:hypothetical protein